MANGHGGFASGTPGATISALEDRVRVLQEALELIAWSKPPIRETEGEWRIKAQTLARESLAVTEDEPHTDRLIKLIEKNGLNKPKIGP